MITKNKEEGATSVFIGAAVYPTLAMFNHSCDPSIVRYDSSTTSSRNVTHTLIAAPQVLRRGLGLRPGHQEHQEGRGDLRELWTHIFPLKQGRQTSESHLYGGKVSISTISVPPPPCAQERLQKQYWFTCKCIPCEQNWPLMHEMTDESLSFRCQECNEAVIFHTVSSNPLLRCVCGTPVPILQVNAPSIASPVVDASLVSPSGLEENRRN